MKIRGGKYFSQNQECHFNQGKDTSPNNQVISNFKGTKERSSER